MPSSARRALGRVAVPLAAVPLVAVGLVAGAPPATGSTPGSTPGSTSVSEREDRLADAVRAPAPDWYECYGGDAECASVRVPEDHDEPDGPTVDLALARVPATSPSRRIGTLVVNPGGPGGSAVLAALTAADYLPEAILQRFDVLGVDPRGTGFSDPVRCFRSDAAQADVLGPLSAPFPVGARETAAAVAAAEAFGRACSSRSARLADAVSTTTSARDLEVVRRALREPALTYLGFSYGSHLGTLYATLFPDRVRAMVLDGVLDPQAWRGDEATRDVPATQRSGAGAAAWRALTEILRRCEEAGPPRCRLAGLTEHPAAAFDDVMARLRRAPVEIAHDGKPLTLGYADVVQKLLVDLYDPDAAAHVDATVSLLWEVVGPDPTPQRQRPARHALARLWNDRGLRPSAPSTTVTPGPADSSLETYAAVICNDTRNPDDARAWPAREPVTQASAPHVGLPWLWASVPCAERTWTARDEDAYTGPLGADTAHPVLVLGSRWDPATPEDGARALAALLPGSRVVSSDSWGHTSFGTSACVTDAVTAYLLTLRMPARGTECTGDVQPFADATARASTEGLQRGVPGGTGTSRGGPAPVVPLLPFDLT